MLTAGLGMLKDMLGLKKYADAAGFTNRLAWIENSMDADNKMRQLITDLLIAECSDGKEKLTKEQRELYYDRLKNIQTAADLFHKQYYDYLQEYKETLQRAVMYDIGINIATMGVGKLIGKTAKLGKVMTNSKNAKYFQYYLPVKNALTRERISNGLDFIGSNIFGGIMEIFEPEVNNFENISYRIDTWAPKQEAEILKAYRKLIIDIRKSYADCKSNDDKKDDSEHHSPHPDANVPIDPSGFVYEAVEDNRVQDVQATIYYKAARENIFGEMVDEEVVWDASEYDQENPLYTDANGEYQWFVPQGLWQVRFEKEGYEPTESDWLPVPPPQLEVNIPIVQLRQPEVTRAIARKDAIDITFDKYMMPSLLNTDNILVTANDQAIAGTIIMLDEQHPYDNTETSYASKVRFVPASPFTASEITLTVSNRVRSYADVPMAQPFQQVFDIEDVDHLQSAATPTASVSSGTEVSPYTEVYLTCSTDRATIRYTIDGTTPDCNTGILYTGHPIMLTSTNAIIRAIACADGFDPSEVATFTYVISTGTHISACGTDGHAHVNVKGGILHVEGLTSPAQVYSAQGMLLMTVTNGTYRLPAGGMYLIRHDKGVKKIVF